MSHIKKFTDFFAILGAVSAIVYLISQFMPFDPLETKSSLGKVKEFFNAHGTVDYMAITVLALLLLFSFVMSLCLRKYPLPVFGASLLPLAWCFFLFDGEQLKERPMLYVIVCILNTAGAFADALLADRRDGGRRAAHSALLCTLLTAIGSVLLFLRAKQVAALSPEDAGVFDRAIVTALEKELSFSPYLRIFLMLLLICVIDVLLHRLYFIETLIFLIPAGFVLVYWSENALPAYGASIVVLCAVGLFSRLLLTLISTPEHKTSDAENTSFLLDLKKRLSK